MRKVVQIAVAPEGDTSWPVLAALADDGTVWVMSIPYGDQPGIEWFPTPPLPQGEPVVSRPGDEIRAAKAARS